MAGVKTYMLSTIGIADSRLVLTNFSPQRLALLADEQLDLISKKCGFLPLALEIVASLFNSRIDWDFDTLISNLDEQNRLRILVDPSNQENSVMASIELSFKNLPEDIQFKFCLLGLFSTPFDRLVLAKIWDDQSKLSAESDYILGYLMTQNLVTFDQRLDHYFVHDLVRVFAIEKFLEQTTDKIEEYIIRHAEFYLEKAYEIENLSSKGGDDLKRAQDLADFAWPNLDIAWQRMNGEFHKWPRPSVANYWLSKFPLQLDFFLSNMSPFHRMNYLSTALKAAKTIGNIGYEIDILIKLGVVYENHGNLDLALTQMQKALKLVEHSTDYSRIAYTLGNIGRVYNDSENPEKAIHYLKQALDIEQRFGNLLLTGVWIGNLGWSYTISGKPELAIDYYKQALEIARKIGDRHNECARLGNMGRAYLDIGERERAVELYIEALEISRELGDLRNEEAWLGNLADFYLGACDIENAINNYNQALEIALKVGDIRGVISWLHGLGESHLKKGEKDQAFKYYHLVLERSAGTIINSRVISTYAKLGEMYTDLNAVEKSVEMYQTGINLSAQRNDKQSLRNLYHSLGIVLKNNFRRDEAINCFEKLSKVAIELGDKNALGDSLGLLGILYLEKGLNKQAIKVLKKALNIFTKLNRKSGICATQGNLGSAYLALNNPTTAITHSENALVLAREINDTRNEYLDLYNLGIAYGEIGEKDKAISFLLEARSISHRVQESEVVTRILWNLARLYSDYENYKEALKFFDELKVADSKNPLVYYNHAVISLEMGDIDSSKVDCEEIDRILPNSMLAWSCWGKYYKKCDDIETSIKFLLNAVESEPSKFTDPTVSIIDIIGSLLLMGEKDRTARFVSSLIVKNPYNYDLKKIKDAINILASSNTDFDNIVNLAKFLNQAVP